MTQLKQMINLPDVTLICISSVNLPQTYFAFQKSVEGINFGAVKLVTHERPKDLPDFIEYSKCYNITNINEYSYYCIYNLTNHVNTSHCLLIQADGFVINPDKWENSWLEYDYIGSLWEYNENAYIDPFGNHQRVGNGGFSLRSKKLLDVPKHEHIEWDVNQGDFYKHMNANNFAEDGNICVHNRHIYERCGCKFAPVEVAARFAHEKSIKETEGIVPFGFHYHLPNNTKL
jgi:hypothetical protein